MPKKATKNTTKSAIKATDKPARPREFSACVQMRLPPAEKTAWAKAAKDSGRSLSGWIRAAAKHALAGKSID